MSKILIFILANLGHCWGIQDLPAMMPHTLGAGALNEHLYEVEKHHGPLSPAQTIDFVMRHSGGQAYSAQPLKAHDSWILA